MKYKYNRLFQTSQKYRKKCGKRGDLAPSDDHLFKKLNSTYIGQTPKPHVDRYPIVKQGTKNFWVI